MILDGEVSIAFGNSLAENNLFVFQVSIVFLEKKRNDGESIEDI